MRKPRGLPSIGRRPIPGGALALKGFAKAVERGKGQISNLSCPNPPLSPHIYLQTASSLVSDSNPHLAGASPAFMHAQQVPFYCALQLLLTVGL